MNNERKVKKTAKRNAEAPNRELQPTKKSKLNRFGTVRVRVEHKIFACNKLLLLQHCSVFKCICELGDRQKLTASCLTDDIFELIHNWMMEKLPLNPNDISLDLLLSVDFLQCKQLEEDILEVFNDVTSYAVKDSLRVYWQAIDKGEQLHARLLLPRVGRSFLVLAASEQFLELPANHVHDLLSCNYLAVHSETEVYYALINWLFADFKKRKHHIRYLLAAVNLLPRQIALLWAANLKAAKIKPDKQLREIIELFQAEITQRYEPERIWLKDPLCPYLDVDAEEPLLMNKFISYLTLLEGPAAEAEFVERIEI